ncbi:MAG TPA: preprotein translocase subunit SecE [Candidatus Binataceae bacterium]|nr:preprotein translocase subunit SecE [Candidatus Binataceae bacterium]
MASIKGYLEEGISFVKESWTELSKVHFPSPRETMQATLVVVALTIVIALWLGLIDMGASRIVRQLVS